MIVNKQRSSTKPKSPKLAQKAVKWAELDVINYTSIMGDLSVLKVYETAAIIGREIEAVIDECGSDAVANLMPHVIK